MNSNLWQRWSPLAAVVFAVTHVTGFILLIGDEVDEKVDSDLISHFEDSGTRTQDIIGFLLVAAGLLFFLLFLSVLRQRLSEAAGSSSNLPDMAVVSGVAGASLFLVAAAAFVAPSLAGEFIDRLTIDPDSVRLLFGLGFALSLGAVILSCGLILATAALAFRGSALPAWVGWLGILAAVIAIAEAFLLPLFTVPAWCLIVGLVLASRPTRA